MDLSREVCIQEYELFVEEIPDEEKPFVFPSNNSPEGPNTKNKLETHKNNYKPGGPKESLRDHTSNKGKDQYIQCVHHQQYYGYGEITYTGDPFYFVFKKGESVRDAVERIRQKLDIDKSEMKFWKFFKIRTTESGRDKRKALDDNDIVTNSDYNNPAKLPAWFGMEHTRAIKREEKRHVALGVKFYDPSDAK